MSWAFLSPSSCGSFHIWDLAFASIQFCVGLLHGNMIRRPSALAAEPLLDSRIPDDL
jgi:hypothetical protein